MDDQLQCDLLSIFHNITTNCSNDIEVARDECKVICIISIMKGIEMCSKYLFDSPRPRRERSAALRPTCGHSGCVSCI